jgi:hypothetical protein
VIEMDVHEHIKAFAERINDVPGVTLEDIAIGQEFPVVRFAGAGGATMTARGITEPDWDGKMREARRFYIVAGMHSSFGYTPEEALIKLLNEREWLGKPVAKKMEEILVAATGDPRALRRRIVCAANRQRGGGVIICGARHWDLLMHGTREALGLHASEFEQGFVCNFGDWHTREEAYVIAARMCQIRRPSASPGGKYLYSECLY